MIQKELKSFLENYAQKIEETIERPVHARIGTYKGEYYQENGDFTDIQGGIFITTHKGNLFKVYDDEKQIEDTFDVFGNESTIKIEEEWFPFMCNDNIISIKQLNLDIKLINIDFLQYGGAWEQEDGGYGCIDIARKKLELVKNVASRYPFEYEYDPSDFDKNPNDLCEDWSDIKFDIKDFNENNINKNNYDKVDAVADDFKEKLVGMLEQLKQKLEWLPIRFRQEFIEEVIGSANQDAHSVRKNCEFFSDDIIDELTEEEKSKMFTTIGDKMNWKEIANKKDDGTFAMYGMKKYLSECSNIYPYMNAECINYIVETFLECIDSVDFITWLKQGNDDGRPMIITRKMLQEDFKDLLVVSEDLEIIRDLFMYLYDIEIWIDKERDCLYTTMWNITYHNRRKLNFMGIAMETERLATLREHQIINWSDINSFVECIAEYGYDINNDYKYKTDDVDKTTDIILERIGQVFPSLQCI